ncbi:MAG: aminotransferase class I/II-fold pyridoxal phosphate-dependent enzyme, partial [Lachnospiraceae bacterium]|nr:aminotransferase class I/II-fold pyridoxal phosphate-dependent enzyme [Lachnospiraceae bacterium]
DTTYVSSVGEYVTRLEDMCKEVCGCDYAVATSAGTTGLHAALVAAGVGRDDLVLLPTFTFIASANAVYHCGAQPWLMDITEDWTMDVDQVERILDEECCLENDTLVRREDGKRVAAIMPVYTLGNVPDMEHFRKIADRYHLPLLADAACAIGATYQGKKLGRLADLSVFSFNGNKTITCGGGGMVFGQDEILVGKVRHLTTTARVNSEYEFDMPGFNYRMTNLQAAVGCAQMERLNEFVEKKRNIRAFYKEKLSNVFGISFFPETEGASCWFSGIVLDQAEGLEEVRRICAGLKESGIEARSFWKPVHLQVPYADAPRAEVQKAEKLWNRIVTLPCATNITVSELEEVVIGMRKVLRVGEVV